MDDKDDVILTAGEWLKSGDRVCIATVVRKDGSAPREVGAKMAFSSAGKTAGSLGGGRVEKQVSEKAGEVMSSGLPLMLDFDLSGASDDLDALCGGNISVFLEPLGRARRLFIMGAGHVGKAVAWLARKVGFGVTLIDDREEFLTGHTVGDRIDTCVARPEAPGNNMKIDESAFVVICTRGHSLDRDWLRVVAGARPRYVGMLGSKHKARRILDELEAEGIPADVLGRVHVPVGLAIGAATPEEIAVSIVAELILEARKTKE
jgi:xanthine dehydrogenase accessory factor